MIHAHDSAIVRAMTRLLIPLIQLFALYVLCFGQYGPGGGFVGGVMLGTSLILGILVFGPEAPPCLLAKKIEHGDGIGLMIFVGVGGLCLIGGGEFLNYSNLEIPWLDTSSRRYLGIFLTQIGVAVDIAVTAISIVFSLSLIDDSEESHD
jgi:multicomponent Na+:H+ antiporter subunit B